MTVIQFPGTDPPPDPVPESPDHEDFLADVWADVAAKIDELDSMEEDQFWLEIEDLRNTLSQWLTQRAFTE